jgi:hypothetical protein
LAQSREIATNASETKGVPPTPGAPTPPPAAGHYYYANGDQSAVPAGTAGMQAYQTQQNPTVDPTDREAHSISQMWLLDWHAGPNEEYSGNSDVEFGWDVDPPLFGTGGPHLFIYRFDGGYPTCYNAGSYYGCPTATKCPNTGPGSAGYPGTNGYVQVSTTEFPGELLTHDDTYHIYSVHNFEGNWWIQHDGTWLGYYAGCAWAYPIGGLKELAAGGEVYSSFTGDPKTQMGNGLPGNTPNAAAWERIFTVGFYTEVNLHSYQNKPTQYTTGNWQHSEGEKSGHGNAFRYGGGSG